MKGADIMAYTEMERLNGKLLLSLKINQDQHIIRSKFYLFVLSHVFRPIVSFEKIKFCSFINPLHPTNNVRRMIMFKIVEINMTFNFCFFYWYSMKPARKSI